MYATSKTKKNMNIEKIKHFCDIKLGLFQANHIDITHAHIHTPTHTHTHIHTQTHTWPHTHTKDLEKFVKDRRICDVCIWVPQDLVHVPVQNLTIFKAFITSDTHRIRHPQLQTKLPLFAAKYPKLLNQQMR